MKNVLNIVFAFFLFSCVTPSEEQLSELTYAAELMSEYPREALAILGSTLNPQLIWN